MNITGMLYGVPLLAHVDFPISEALNRGRHVGPNHFASSGRSGNGDADA
jgi:hypothetical protein